MRIGYLLGVAVCALLLCAQVAAADETCAARTCEGLGRECGLVDDGCGGVIACGVCDDAYKCNKDGKCAQHDWDSLPPKEGQAARSVEQAQEDTPDQDGWEVARAAETAQNTHAARAPAEEGESVDTWEVARQAEVEAESRPHKRAAEEVEEHVHEDAWAKFHDEANPTQEEQEAAERWLAMKAGKRANRPAARGALRAGKRSAHAALVEEAPAHAAKKARTASCGNHRRAAPLHALHGESMEYKPVDLAALHAARESARESARKSALQEVVRVAQQEEVAQVPQEEVKVHEENAAEVKVEDLKEDVDVESGVRRGPSSVHRRERIPYRPDIHGQSGAENAKEGAAAAGGEGEHDYWAILVYALSAVGVMVVVAASAMFIQKRRNGGAVSILSSSHVPPKIHASNHNNKRRASKHAISIAPSPVLSNGKPLNLYVPAQPLDGFSNNHNDNNNNSNNTNNNNAQKKQPNSKSTPKLGNTTPRLRLTPVMSKVTPDISAASLRVSQSFSL